MSDTQVLWQPNSERIANSAMGRLMQAHGFASYEQAWQWSVNDPVGFWSEMWTVLDIRCTTPFERACIPGSKFYDNRWFAGAKLNFAENLLRRRDDKPAIVSLTEHAPRVELSYHELYVQVEKLAAAMHDAGIGPGDRVAGFMPNVAETVVAMLAATSLGAIWSSCSPDFGLNGVLDRFGQIEPKLLIAADGYVYNGKSCDCLARIRDIAEKIESLQHIIVVPLLNPSPNIATLPAARLLADVLESVPPRELTFSQLPFEHPLFIMYSSGTTGTPKCIVHGAGGTLLQHKKEHQLHCDIGPEDVVFYFTTCGWMMWNWLVSALASEATLVLYDGSPFADNGKLLLDAIDNENISVFGTSAKFISALEKAGHKPRESHKLDSLKAILSTGSPLSHESFDYIYRDFKADLQLSSISGGTDIISCFVLGNPVLPVRRGEIQCRGLGMAVEFWAAENQPVQREKAELVCTKPFVSCPVGFWNDPDNSKFEKAYFKQFPGVWAHGDYGELTAHDGVIIHGRSDAVLNPGGVRIGTAEIYRQVEKLDDVIDSIVVGQNWQDDVRVVLFVVLREGLSLNDALCDEIRSTIRRNTTPRHVPAKILQVAEIPRTISGKIVEIAVRNVIHGDAVKNTDALANPQALEHFRNLAELQD